MSRWVTSILILACATGAGAQTVEEIASSIRKSEDSIQSMQATFLHEQTTFPEFVKYYKLDEPPQTVVDLNRVRWAFSGPNHAAYSTKLDPKTGKIQLKHESFEIVRDNKTFTGAFVPKLSNAVDGAVQMDVMERIIYPASPYRLSTAPFGQPLSLMLTEGDFRILRESSNEPVGRTIVLYGRTKRGFETKLVLAERLAWAPIRLEQVTEDGKALRIIEHKDYVHLEGPWTPTLSSDSFTKISGNRAKLVEHEYRVDPATIRVNEVAASFFSVPIKNGSVVRDRVDNDFYRISLAGRKVELDEKYLPEDRRISKHSYLGFLMIGGLAAVPLLGLIALRRLSR